MTHQDDQHIEEQNELQVTTSGPRLVIEVYGNDRKRTYHVNTRIAQERLYNSLSCLESMLKFGYGDNLPETIELAKLFYVEGVSNVTLDIYEVRIEIANAFHWRDIEPVIIAIIKSILRWDDVEIIYRDNRFGDLLQPIIRDYPAEFYQSQRSWRQRLFRRK